MRQKTVEKKNVMLKYSITGTTAGENEERVMEDERNRGKINTTDKDARHKKPLF